MAEIIDGKKVAAEIKNELKLEIEGFKNKGLGVPGLAVVLIGENPASQSYVGMKEKDCVEIGIKSISHKYDADYGEEKLLKLIDTLNKDPEVSGIIVQLPLPKGYDENKVINAILPEKDVDCFHPVNIGKMVIGDEDGFFPCTPYGCQHLISQTVKELKGKHLVVVGRSNIVGKPMANLMIQKNERANCIVTVCHSAAADLSVYTKQADILVVATGQAGLITADMVKEGVVVIDVGSNMIEKANGKRGFVGDVVYDEVAAKASAITPVPGGVGPMTRAMLLKNTVKAFKLKNNL